MGHKTERKAVKPTKRRRPRELPQQPDLDAVQRQRDPDWPRAGSLWEPGAGGETVEVLSVALNVLTAEWEVAYRVTGVETCWATTVRQWYKGFRRVRPCAADD